MTSDTYLEDNTRLSQTWILHYKTIPCLTLYREWEIQFSGFVNINVRIS